VPFYDYACTRCDWKGEQFAKIEKRDETYCPACDGDMVRIQGAPLGRMAGQITKGGGPDRFTADMLGIPLKELPVHLRAEPPK